MNIALENNNLILFKLLDTLTVYTEEIIDYDWLITIAINQKMNNILEWIIYNKYSYINDSLSNWWNFYQCCLSNNIYGMNLLSNFMLDIKNIISQDKFWIFRMTCKQNCIESSKLLLDLHSTIDVTVNNHEIFKFAVKHKLIQILELFQNKKDIYIIELENNKIACAYILKTKLITEKMKSSELLFVMISQK